MKKSPKEQDLISLLGPSKFSGDGFLGDDPRTPDQIISDDIRELQDTGISREELVAALKECFAKAVSALEVPVEIAPGVTAEYFDSRGKTPSPFRGDGMFQKGEVVIKDSKNGLSIILTALSINLIERHDFFQGRGSRFRINPRDAVAILRLTK